MCPNARALALSYALKACTFCRCSSPRTLVSARDNMLVYHKGHWFLLLLVLVLALVLVLVFILVLMLILVLVPILMLIPIPMLTLIPLRMPMRVLVLTLPFVLISILVVAPMVILIHANPNARAPAPSCALNTGTLCRCSLPRTLVSERDNMLGYHKNHCVLHTPRPLREL